MRSTSHNKCQKNVPVSYSFWTNVKKMSPSGVGLMKMQKKCPGESAIWNTCQTNIPVQNRFLQNVKQISCWIVSAIMWAFRWSKSDDDYWARCGWKAARFCITIQPNFGYTQPSTKCAKIIGRNCGISARVRRRSLPVCIIIQTAGATNPGRNCGIEMLQPFFKAIYFCLAGHCSSLNEGGSIH